MAPFSGRLRFSLGSIFVAMMVLAIGCSFVVIAPDELSHLVLGLLWIVALSVLVVGIVFGNGDQRAFCIGAFIVASSVWTNVGGRFMHGVHFLLNEVVLRGSRLSSPLDQWVDLVVLAIVAVANGLLCVRARAYFEG